MQWVLLLQTTIGPTPDLWVNLGLLGLALSGGVMLHRALLATLKEENARLAAALSREVASHEETRQMLYESLRTSARAVGSLAAKEEARS
jgi:hypothetical protein